MAKSDYNTRFIFNEQSQKLLRAMQKKYEDHFEFLVKLEGLYKGQRLTQEVKMVKTSVDTIGKIIDGIDKILEGKVKEPAASAQKIFEEIERVDATLKVLAGQGAEKLSKAMQKRVEAAEKKTGMTLDKLSKSSETIKGRFRHVARPAGFLQRHPEVTEAFAKFGAGISREVLGPLAPFIHGGIRLASQHKARQTAVKNLALTQALTREGEQPEAYGSLYRNLFGFGRSGVLDGEGEGRQRRGIRSSLVAGGESGLSYSDLKVAVANGLFTFFDKDAYRTHWTRDLLDALKGGPIKDKMSVGGETGGIVKGLGGKILESLGLAGLFNSLKGMLGGLASTIGKLAGGVGLLLGKVSLIGAAAGAGWSAGRWLGENIEWGGKSLDEHTQGFFEKHLFHKVDENAATDAASPRIKRIMELQQHGLSQQEAIKAVDAEGLRLKKAAETYDTTRPQGTPAAVRPQIQDLTTPQNLNENLIQKLMNSIDDLGRKIHEQKSSLPSSGRYAATSIGDPWLEALNMGVLDVEA